jgi:hypothetical protein
MGSTCAELQTNWELQRHEWNSLVGTSNCMINLSNGLNGMVTSYIWMICIACGKIEY